MPNDDDGDIVVYLRRTKTDTSVNNVNNAQPVAFGVKFSYYRSDGKVYTTNDYIFYVHFQYRGPYTEEYSTRIPIKEIWKHLSNPSTITKIYYLTFYPLATNYTEPFRTASSTFVPMALNSFDVLKIGHDEPYSDTWADRFHLGEDYHSNFDGYTFANTQGIADPHNSIAGWQMLDAAEIARLRDMGITYPDFSMLTSESSALRNPYPIAPGQERQPTHTVEHTVYAMPGDIVPLYPYYGLPFTINFKENFIHWYDFANGGRIEHETPWNGKKVDLLDFLIDPSGIQRTSDYGFFGGKYMAFGKKINVSTVDEYIDAVNYVNDHDHNEYINITADLDFSGRDDVPMIGYEWGRRFAGVLNGNGHIIKNLVINKPDVDEVGIISRTDVGAVVENLIIDKSCSFTGKRDVGLIGYHAWYHLTISNVHTEATIKAVNGQAGGLVGYAAGGTSYMTIEDCYVGGDIGIAGQTENAALIGWLNTSDHNVSTLKNVLVNCTVAGTDGNGNRKYIRSNNNSSPLTTEANGTRIRGDIRFINCRGYLEPNDKAWIQIPVTRTLPAGALAKLGWTDQKTPPMANNLTLNDYSGYEFYSYYLNDQYIIGDEQDYINKITEFNSKAHTYYRAYIQLTQDLDFSAYGPDEVPMIGEATNKEFAGLFNGNGHTIKNLKIVRYDPDPNKHLDGVGMFGFTAPGAHIENLIIDSSCYFEGHHHVGLVGYHRWNRIYFRNIKTEATVVGTHTGEQAAAGIVGWSNGGWSDQGTLNLENVYIGGVIGNPDDTNAHNNAVICAWQSNYWLRSSLEFKNIVVDCELYGSDISKKKYIRFGNYDVPVTMDGETYVKSHTYTVVDNNVEKEFTYSLRYTNCYGNIDPADIPWQLLDEEFEMPDMDGWSGTYPPSIGSTGEIYALNGGKGDRTAGTIATFFCPRDPFNPELAQNLPDEEYVIAADISHTYNPEKNLDMDEQVIYEPIISSRHIFHIRDGKAFADETSGSVESNRNYLRKNRKFVTLRKGSQWQLRLDNPVPITNSSAKGYRWAPSHYYYIDSDNNYRRVPQLRIVIRNAETNNTTSYFNCSFTNNIPGYGCREVDGVKYATGEAYFESLGKHPDYHGSEYDKNKEYEYNTMISGTAEYSGHYLVQIVACDYNGNQLKIKDTSTPLVLMEYDFTVLAQDASFIETMDNLYSNEKYSEYTPEALDKTYGSPTVKIDFDEYMAINRLPDSDPLKSKLISRSTYLQTHPQTSNPSTDAADTKNGMQKTWFKWPVPWTQSSYMFGYNDRYDYSMYQLASHSDNVVWKWKAMEFPESADPASMSGNNPDDGTGLYDRRYYASKLSGNARASAEQGYFYYVNAASDPGVTASLRINDLCQGSRVVVSAWISEFSSTSEKVNLSFNFVAVLKNDVETNYPDSKFTNSQRIILHKYITGYPSVAGKWYNVYYSFLPRLAEFSAQGVTTDMVDHYELELDNNAKNSNGADYAVDDIRAYVVPPSSEITQLHPACDGYATRMKLSTPFYTLLELARMPEAAAGEETKDMNVYYTILDKEEYDKAIKENKTYEEAFNASVIAFHQTGAADSDAKHYDEVAFKSRYSDNPEYEYDPDAAISQYAFREEKKGERMIVFESDVKAGVLTPGKSYYFILRSPLENESIVEGQEYLFFDMQDRCANVSEVTVQGSLVVKWEGEMVTNIKDYIICPYQYPVIQVDIIGKDPEHEGETKPMETNAYIDWFHGTYNEFMAYCEEGNPAHTLREALGVFRIYYPEEEKLNGVVPQKKENEEEFKQWMIDLLVKATTPTEEQPVAPLRLYKPSYVVPASPIPEGETEITKSIVAIQRNCDYGAYWVCADPQEIQMTVRNVSPMMLHGLPGIPYPESLTDVPLRIGLDQIRSDNGDQGFTMKSIDIPVRVANTTTSQKQFTLTNQHLRILNADNEIEEVDKVGAVILAYTNDPEYKDLGIGAYDNPDNASLKYVGDVTKLNVTAGVNTDQYFTVVFDKNFDFKEGYEYTMRMEYEVDNNVAGVTEGTCNGQDVFTLKIVPKYLAWTGDENLNWNNDNNWRRVSKEDLLLPDGSRPTELTPYITDGSRNGASYPNTAAYAPLDFTHVIVEGGEMEAPYMYAPAASQTVADEYAQNKSYSWPKNPNKGSAPTYADDPGAEGVGAATALIHYDMAAFDFAPNEGRNNALTGCRPWYANTCREIHFKPGGTLMNQHELNYLKAWVDVEIDPMRWYTLSLPLREVVAGDFYLPTDGARQLTELFQDITFNTDLNDRFRPAVFQRGWDKSVARVYELEHPGFDSPQNVAVKAFWSHVYNDVTEPYGAGTGFSVKADVSRLGSEMTDPVLFRFPKADAQFLYFNQDGDKNGHLTSIDRTEAQYRLSDSHGSIHASAASAGKYFLVGNPFITHLDIAKFLDANKDVLEQKYWIVTAKGQIAGSIGSDGTAYAAVPSADDDDPVADPTAVAPMQGFFVEAKAEAAAVNLKYDETMMRRYDAANAPLTSTARSADGAQMLKITACNDGIASSAAIVVTGRGIAPDVNAIDNSDIGVESTVYTVKGNNALSINVCDDMEGTEIGVIAREGTETVLRFEGVEAATDCELCLYDKLDGSISNLYDGMELTVTGPVAGRLFLTAGNPDEKVTAGIIWAIYDDILYVADTARSGSLSVTVCDVAGRVAASAAVDADSVEIPLPHGIYVAEIVTAKERKCIKVRL